MAQFVEMVSLGREDDAKEIDAVRKSVLASIEKRHDDLTKAISDKLKSRKIPDYHDPRAFTDIKLHDVFGMWWTNLEGELLNIAYNNGARGQSDSFHVPPYRDEFLNSLEWIDVPKLLSRSSGMHGVRYTGISAGSGAGGGGGLVGYSTYAKGLWTASKYPMALKAVGAGAAVGGISLGVVVFVAWLGSSIGGGPRPRPTRCSCGGSSSTLRGRWRTTSWLDIAPTQAVSRMPTTSRRSTPSMRR